MCVIELLITGFTNWLICLDHWNPLVHQLIARRPFKSINFGIPHFLCNISTWFVKKCFNQAITMVHLVAYALHPSYKDANLLPDPLIVVTDFVTLGSFFPFFTSKNPFLPIGREETQPWFLSYFILVFSYFFYIFSPAFLLIFHKGVLDSLLFHN